MHLEKVQKNNNPSAVIPLRNERDLTHSKFFSIKISFVLEYVFFNIQIK